MFCFWSTKCDFLEETAQGKPTHSGCCATCRSLNWNVRLVLVYATLLSMYSSLVSQTPLSAYILLMRPHDYTSVGVATGIQGVVSLVVAFPVAALADRYGRQVMLRVAAVLALVVFQR